MKLFSEFLKEKKAVKKTKSASKVLQLMDKDWSYGDAVKKIMKDDKIPKPQLEKELEPFI